MLYDVDKQLKICNIANEIMALRHIYVYEHNKKTPFSLSR
jgi:hypothetical protein